MSEVRYKTADVIRYVYKNPGIHTIGSVAHATGMRRDLISRALSMLADSADWFERMSMGTYIARPPEYPQSEIPVPVPPDPDAADVRAAREARARIEAGEPVIPWEQAKADAFSADFVEILPDDDEIYPPFKVRIYDHFRGKRGEQWFRTKDEMGKRGIFRWVDDD